MERSPEMPSNQDEGLPTAAAANPYDVTPYIDLSYVATHPDRLATMARLLGREPAPLNTCRVLEIGCAAGGNLLPMAYSLPQAEFVGIDYSQRQIEDGQQRIRQLGFDNVRLICADLGALDDEFEAELGTFDYFIAHGFYSWTPPAVRDAMLALCKRVLRPNGVAYVSYNTYPGWHTLKLIREAMLYHAQGADTPDEVATQGRQMASFLAQYANEGLHKEVFRHYVEMLNSNLKGTDNSFLLHDELSEVNDPVYFYQFVDHAQKHGLQYLVEVELRAVLISSFKPETQNALKTMIWDAIDLEQKMDFVRNQMFRQTLLCHADPPVDRRISPQGVTESWLRSQARRVTTPNTQLPADVVQFRSKDEATLATNHPLSIKAMEILAEAWPRALHFTDLTAAARKALGDSPDNPVGAGPQEVMALASTLLRAHGQSSQLVELHSFEPRLVKSVSERPEASRMARFEAQSRQIVTNVWHDRVTLLPAQQALLRLLDGTRTREELAKQLQETLSSAEMDEHLRFFAYAGLLVA
jgi:methyltransferase-like protein/ubiquinone/menaquinone biosynthesis C-methylase UbiE